MNRLRKLASVFMIIACVLDITGIYLEHKE